MLLAVCAAFGGACRTAPADAPVPVPEEYVSGCVSRDHTFREYLDACTREYGTEFLLLDGVERELGRVSSTVTWCFVEPGTKASELQLWADIHFVQAGILRWRAKSGVDLMIDREPLPGTNTYRIYRLPRDAQSPWSASTR